MNISILYGGASTERKISIKTGLAVAEAIQGMYDLDLVDLGSEIYKSPHRLLDADVVFNALHGGDGENGNIQSLLNLHNITYTGSGPGASKIAMDKNITKLIAQSINIPTPKWILLKRNNQTGMKLQDNQSQKFSYPYVVKPSNEGSTFGLSIINSSTKN